MLYRWSACAPGIAANTGRVIARRRSALNGTFRMAGFRPRPGVDVSVTGRRARMGSPVPGRFVVAGRPRPHLCEAELSISARSG